MPAKHRLSWSLVVFRGDLADHGVLQRAAVAAVSVEGDATDRRPGLRQDSVLGVERLHLALLEIGMNLDLVHGWHHRRLGERLGQVLDHEVAATVRTSLSIV